MSSNLSISSEQICTLLDVEKSSNGICIKVYEKLGIYFRIDGKYFPISFSDRMYSTLKYSSKLLMTKILLKIFFQVFQNHNNLCKPKFLY
jgi:hypothetical protein